MARLSTYDTILIDIRLSDLAAYDAFCQLRPLQPHARIILMTAFGYDPSHAIVKCRQEGLRSVLYKPFRVDQLLDALEKPETGPSPKPASEAEVVRA
jgi:CheY-like chemotaxis protein